MVANKPVSGYDFKFKIKWTELQPTYRLATLHDELHLTTVFSRMLRELEPLGHDILPTDYNVDLFWKVFEQALQKQKHGIVVAFAEGECIGAVFMVPEHLGLVEMTPGRAVDWGCYVVPRHRRQGIATRLRDVALRCLKKTGTKQVITNILTKNRAGMASYDHLGAKLLAHTYTINLEELD